MENCVFQSTSILSVYFSLFAIRRLLQDLLFHILAALFLFHPAQIFFMNFVAFNFFAAFSFALSRSLCCQFLLVSRRTFYNRYVSITCVTFAGPIVMPTLLIRIHESLFSFLPLGCASFMIVFSSLVNG